MQPSCIEIVSEKNDDRFLENISRKNDIDDLGGEVNMTLFERRITVSGL